MSSLEALAADLLNEPPTVIEALLATLDPEEARVVALALEAADLDAWVAGRQGDEIRREAESGGGAHWFQTMFPSYAMAPMARHMLDLWEWVWTVRHGIRPRPYVAGWFRGGAKSMTAEAATIALGATGRRSYGLYVSGTQDQADKHVTTIGGMLESPRFAAVYPEMASRAVTQYGTAKGWSRQRLYTSSGFVVDALGLSVEARGIRVEEQRPDWIVFDDIDALTDGPAMVKKKIGLLTETILPAGSLDLAVLGVQNLITPISIFSRLVDPDHEEPADFLADRIVSGPIPAIDELDVGQDDEGRWVIKGGTPTWDGYGLESAQNSINTFGLTAFLRECQHLVKARPGGMFDHLTFEHCRLQDVPPLVKRACWVDPAVTDTDQSDSQGIQIDGRAADDTMYRLWSWEHRSTPQKAITLAIRMAHEYGCPTVGIETDQGGDTWASVYREACDAVASGEDGGDPIPRHLLPRFKYDKAGAGYGPKVHRASQMLADYERNRKNIVHVLGTHQVLEAGLFRYPKTKPLDLVDAAWWSWKELRGGLTILSIPDVTVPKPPIVTRGPGAPARVVLPTRTR